jgi:DNA polymerase I
MMKAWLIDADYITEDGNAVIRLWCKDEEGVFIAYDRSFKPYFYALKEEGISTEELLEIKVQRKKEVIAPEKIEEVTLKSLGKHVEVFKIYVKHPQHVPKLREVISDFCEVREADIPFVYRYLIDKDLACMDGVVIDAETKAGKLRCYEVKDIRREERKDFPDLKVMAFDCEMLTEVGMPDPEKDPIIVIAIKTDDSIEIISGDDEKELLERFVELVNEFDPGIIVGYNQDNFDWPYIKKRAEKLGVRLNIGRDGSELAIRGGRPKIAGRLNVDLYDVAMRTIDVKVKKLENIAEFLGRKIELSEIEAKDIYRYWKAGDRGKVITYSKQDVFHTYYIAEELLPMYYELCRMIRIPLDDATRSGRGKQVDLFLLSEAHRIGEIAPNPAEYALKYEGAFVIEPARGLHEDVVCLDFASMYPSIMISYNISPDTLSNCEDCYVAPEVGHKFKKQPDGFFKRILQMLIERRKEIKKTMKLVEYDSAEYKLLDIKQTTLKVLTNSFYGYTGWNLARWYCRECAEATTAWGRHFIKTSARIAEEMGFKVLYGDTDSIFVKKDNLGVEELKKEVKGLIKRLSGEMPVQIEIEDFYKTTFFVEKKRYAGLTYDGRIIIKGLEVRRGDWCELAKKVQRDVIETILRDKNPERAAEYIRDIIREIKNGKVPLEDYVIYKGLTRKPSKYESVQAHVKAAMKAAKKGIAYQVGSKIGFVVTKGSGNIGDRAFPFDLIDDFDGETFVDLEGNKYKLDKDYYIENQVLPSVLRILERFNYSEDQLKGVEQKTLDSFW